MDGAAATGRAHRAVGRIGFSRQDNPVRTPPPLGSGEEGEEDCDGELIKKFKMENRE